MKPETKGEYVDGFYGIIAESELSDQLKNNIGIGVEKKNSERDFLHGEIELANAELQLIKRDFKNQTELRFKTKPKLEDYNEIVCYLIDPSIPVDTAEVSVVIRLPGKDFQSKKIYLTPFNSYRYQIIKDGKVN